MFLNNQGVVEEINAKCLKHGENENKNTLLKIYETKQK